MARTRLLSPKFFLDDDLAERSAYARLTFAGLILIADREGRLDDRPKVISAELFPFEEVDMDALLDELAAPRNGSGGGGFIVRYQFGGRRYLAVRNFLKYQTPHFREAQSLIPAPPGEAEPEAENEAWPGAEQPCMDPVTVPVPVPVPVSVTRKPAAEPAHAGDRESEFAVWWNPGSRSLEASEAFWRVTRENYAEYPPGEIDATWARLTLWLRERESIRVPAKERDGLCAWVQGKFRNDATEWLKRAGSRSPPQSNSIEHTVPPIDPEAPVSAEMQAIRDRHQAREAARMERVKAWREERPPEGLPPRLARKWAEEHKARRP